MTAEPLVLNSTGTQIYCTTSDAVVRQQLATPPTAPGGSGADSNLPDARHLRRTEKLNSSFGEYLGEGMSQENGVAVMPCRFYFDHNMSEIQPHLRRSRTPFCQEI